MDTYKVELSCTNGMRNTVNTNEKEDALGNYIDVEEGVAYVVTSDPGQIFKFFNKRNVKSITRMGIGYMLIGQSTTSINETAIPITMPKGFTTAENMELY